MNRVEIREARKMNWEINERREGYTIWQGRDAEGRRCYATTANRDRMAVEPSGANIYYTKAAAVEVRRHSDALED